MTDQTDVRLPDEVHRAAVDRLAEARYEQHPDNQHMRYGLTNYAFNAALETAYAAGRASMLDLLVEVTDELQAVSKTCCWSGNFAACVNDGCIHRRALIARARDETTPP